MQDIKDLRIKMKDLYTEISSPVFCNVLNVDVYFNAGGFFHLRYDGSQRKRKVKEEYNKLSLLPLVIPTIKHADKMVEEVREISGKKIYYWGIIAIVGKSNARIKVILKRNGENGKVFFWSVMRLR
jgi:hypothetical protein